MSFENMIIMGKATPKLTDGGYPKHDATGVRTSVLEDNVSRIFHVQFTKVRTNALGVKCVSVPGGGASFT